MAHSHGYLSSPLFDPNLVPPNNNPALPYPTNDPTLQAHFPQAGSAGFGANAANVYDPNSPANVYDTSGAHGHPNVYIPANTYTAGATYAPSGVPTYDPNGAPTYDPNVAPNVHTFDASGAPNIHASYSGTVHLGTAQSYAPGSSTNVQVPYVVNQEGNPLYFETRPRDPTPPQKDHEMSTSDKAPSPEESSSTDTHTHSVKRQTPLDILNDIRGEIITQSEKIEKANAQARNGIQQAKRDARETRDGIKELKTEVVGLGDKIVGLGNKIATYSERVTSAFESNSALLRTMSERLIRVENDSTQLVVDTRLTKQQVESFATQVETFPGADPGGVSLPFNAKKLIEAIAEAAARSVAEATARCVTETLGQMTLQSTYRRGQVSSSAQIRELGEEDSDAVDGSEGGNDAEDEDEDVRRRKAKGKAKAKVKIEEEDAYQAGEEGEEESDDESV